MHELAERLARWDWSDAEVVAFGGPGQEISRTLPAIVPSALAPLSPLMLRTSLTCWICGQLPVRRFEAPSEV